MIRLRENALNEIESKENVLNVNDFSKIESKENVLNVNDFSKTEAEENVLNEIESKENALNEIGFSKIEFANNRSTKGVLQITKDRRHNQGWRVAHFVIVWPAKPERFEDLR